MVVEHTHGVVSAKGSAKVLRHDFEDGPREDVCIYLALSRACFLSIQQLNKGGPVNLTPHSSELSAPNGTKFYMVSCIISTMKVLVVEIMVLWSDTKY